MMDKTIQSIIRAFLLDYPRRKTIAAEVGTIDNKNDRASISAFMAWNERIDKALTVIDEPLRVCNIFISLTCILTLLALNCTIASTAAFIIRRLIGLFWSLS